jgi:hypothetical protein
MPAEQPLLCPQCRNQVRPGARFCRTCGTALAVSEQPTPAAPSRHVEPEQPSATEAPQTVSPSTRLRPPSSRAGAPEPAVAGQPPRHPPPTHAPRPTAGRNRRILIGLAAFGTLAVVAVVSILVLTGHSKTSSTSRPVQSPPGPTTVSSGSSGSNGSSTSASPGTSCGGDVSVGPNTTCGFAQNVADGYRATGSSVIRAYSPKTDSTYAMTCSGSNPTICHGGNDATVYIFTAAQPTACPTFTGPGDNLVHSSNFRAANVSCGEAKTVVERCSGGGTCNAAGSTWTCRSDQASSGLESHLTCTSGTKATSIIWLD